MKRINRWYIFSMKTELSYLAFLNSFPSIPFYFVLIARLRRGDCSPSGQGFREQLKRYRVTRYTPCYVPMNIKIRFRADCGRTDFNRSIKPSDSSCRLDAKPKLPRRLFKNQNRQTSPFRQHHCHFRQKRYNRYFLTVETNVRPSGWTAEGRQEQTDKLPNNPSGIRTLVGSDIGWLRRWAIGRNILRFYGSARIYVQHCVPAIVGKAGSVCDRHGAKLCQTDATSCHETENGGSKRRFGYICPELKTWYMEVVIIEKNTFEALLSGVETLTGKVGALCRRCNDKQMQKWLDGEEVCRLLRISPRTLQSLRDNRTIGCTQINRKFYYKPQEIERLMPIAGQFRDGSG